MLAVGRYDVPAAAWIYGANMILLAVTAFAISRMAERDSGRARANDGRVELSILIVSAVLSIVTSLFAPDYAMLPLSAQSCLSIREARCVSTLTATTIVILLRRRK